MKTYRIYKTSKRSQLFFDESENTFKNGKDWKDFTFEQTNKPERERETRTIEASSLEEAKYKWVGLQVDIAEKSKQMREGICIKKQAEIEKLLALKKIPSTVENISLVLEYLNSQNWGSWSLPSMEIGYSAHQYDCEGTQITTIKLDKPILFCGNMVSKFKSGSKRGHLEKYHEI